MQRVLEILSASIAFGKSTGLARRTALDQMLDNVWLASGLERPELGTRATDIPDSRWNAAMKDGLDAGEPTIEGGSASSTA